MRPNIDLTHKKFWELNGILENNYFIELDELPEDIRALAYQAVLDLSLFLAHEHTFKEHHIDETIRNLGILLGHPAPQNQSQSMPPINRFQLEKLIDITVKPYRIITHYDSHGSPVITRQGVLNLNRNLTNEADAISREEFVAYTCSKINEKLTTLPTCSHTQTTSPVKSVAIPDEKRQTIAKHLKNARDCLSDDDASALTAEDIWHAMNNQLSSVNTAKLSFYAFYHFLVKIAIINGYEEHLPLFEYVSDKTALIYLLLQGKNTEKSHALLRKHDTSILPCYANEFLRMILSQEPVNEDALYLVIQYFPFSAQLKLYFLESYLEKCSKIIPEKDLTPENALPMARVAIIILRSLNEKTQFSRSKQYLTAIANGFDLSLELKILMQCHGEHSSSMFGACVKINLHQLVHNRCYQSVIQLIRFTNIFPEFICLDDLRQINIESDGNLVIQVEDISSLDPFAHLFEHFVNFEERTFRIGSTYQLDYTINVSYIPSLDPSLPGSTLQRPTCTASSPTLFQFRPINPYPVDLSSVTPVVRPVAFSFQSNGAASAAASSASSDNSAERESSRPNC
jgi:hypothetical protein